MLPKICLKNYEKVKLNWRRLRRFKVNCFKKKDNNLRQKPPNQTHNFSVIHSEIFKT